MTFLQPFVLWGLPLALLPVLIHLLNRMRFRTQRWAAMSFLFSANRASTRYAQVRQWIILALRTLALLGLIFAIARPLTGRWLGWAFSSSPDLVLVVLDRSSSMDERDAASSSTRREQALRAISNAAATVGDRTRFVILENVLHKPQEIAKRDVATFTGLPQTKATDTAADIPAMLDAAAEWLNQNPAGLTEIWIASDLQRTNWQPESSRWPAVTARLAALKQSVRVRLLAVAPASATNVSVTLDGVRRRDTASELDVAMTFECKSGTASEAIPVQIALDGVTSQFSAGLTSGSLKLRRPVQLTAGQQSGWGKIELPADGNLRDNSAYFLYGPKPGYRTAIVAADEASRRLLRLAASASGSDCDDIIIGAEGTEWKKYALVIWQAALPTGQTAQQLHAFAEGGGVVAFFPPGVEDPQSFAGASWGLLESMTGEETFRITHWDEQDGPLAKTDEGLSLPVNEIASPRRQLVLAGGESRASFSDTKPFLTDRVIGKGRAYFCATLPQWSKFADGRVLVPMLQRIIERGGQRFENVGNFVAGDPTLVSDPSGWVSVDAPKKDVRFDAGIYRKGSQLIAVNRPAIEDDPEAVEAGAVGRLFGTLSFQLFESRNVADTPLQREIWRAMLIAMLLALLGEAYLALPGASAQKETSASAGQSRKGAAVPA